MGVEEKVTLVIPGRNAARTLDACLKAVAPLVGQTPLGEILYVDDGSRDDSPHIAERCGVRVISSPGRGPGAARNAGWRAATAPLIWFIDADCVAEPDALPLLLLHLADPRVGGVGGSYGNMETGSLLACLIHEEIVERHRRMAARVTFLGSFNVLYRREVLAQVSGFDERFLKAQDAELSWRVLEAGYELAFEPRSRVGHFHPIHWGTYLRTQREQGFWRVRLYHRYRARVRGDSYSGIIDHLQPPLSVICLASMPLFPVSGWRWVPLSLMGLLLFFQMPMTLRLLWRTRRVQYALYALMGTIRAVWRGAGMMRGLFALMAPGVREPARHER